MQTGQTWTEERIALLKNYVEAGLSCRQIANQIGVTRNAVIGKVSRLGISSTKGVAAPLVPNMPNERRATPRRPGKVSQRRILSTLRVSSRFPHVQTGVEECIIDRANHRTLLALGEGQCRWPIGEPGKEDFCFCGGAQVAGLSYCPPHARLAYRGSARTQNTFVSVRM